MFTFTIASEQRYLLFWAGTLNQVATQIRKLRVAVSKKLFTEAKSTHRRGMDRPRKGRKDDANSVA